MIRLGEQSNEKVAAAAAQNRAAGDWVADPPVPAMIVLPRDVAVRIDEEDSAAPKE